MAGQRLGDQERPLENGGEIGFDAGDRARRQAQEPGAAVGGMGPGEDEAALAHAGDPVQARRERDGGRCCELGGRKVAAFQPRRIEREQHVARRLAEVAVEMVRGDQADRENGADQSGRQRRSPGAPLYRERRQLTGEPLKFVAEFDSR